MPLLRTERKRPAPQGTGPSHLSEHWCLGETPTSWENAVLHIVPASAAVNAQVLPFHPFAKYFPLLNGVAFDALVADVKANGLREPITLYQGEILDGVNRYLACLKAKVEPRFEEFEGDDAAALAFVISKNIHRRHLKAKEKREVVALLLKAKPETSNNAIAKQVKVDDKTVTKVRRELESTSEIPKLDKTVGADGKARKQPTKKPTKKPDQTANADDPETSAEAIKAKFAEAETAETATTSKTVKNNTSQRELDAAYAHIAELEAAREHDKDLAEQLRAAEIKIAKFENEIAGLQDAKALKAENGALRAALEKVSNLSGEARALAAHFAQNRDAVLGKMQRAKTAADTALGKVKAPSNGKKKKPQLIEGTFTHIN
jgi:ParB-like chromosome segregation protein Spo0J